jgi:hypothetical protein
LRTDLDYFNTHWRARSLSLDKIREAVGLSPQPIITCHGFAILSSKVIRSLRTDFMLPRGLSFADLLAISPYEFSWYTLYLQANHTIDMHQRESLFRCVHTPQQYTLLSLSGVTVEDMSRGYIGLTSNLNLSRNSVRRWRRSWVNASRFEHSAAPCSSECGLQSASCSKGSCRGADDRAQSGCMVSLRKNPHTAPCARFWLRVSSAAAASFP